VSAEVVEHYCRREWAVHLDDVMLRRSGWHYYRSDAEQVAQQVAAWMADLFAWDTERQAAELAHYRSLQ
jgi:glycerol-3-phosphate dehydrogenase